jgi:hypothetical protein
VKELGRQSEVLQCQSEILVRRIDAKVAQMKLVRAAYFAMAIQQTS